jgi:hypothetical protein
VKKPVKQHPSSEETSEKNILQVKKPVKQHPSSEETSEVTSFK